MIRQENQALSEPLSTHARPRSSSLLRALAPPCLLAIAALFAGNAVADTLTVEFFTGGDDLRGGNDNVHLRLLDVEGEIIAERRNANDLRGWAGGSTHAVTLDIDAGDLDRLAAVELETTFGGGFDGDNWNLDGLRIRRYEKTLFEARGTPLFRFTGAQRSRSFPFAVQRCQVDADCDDGLSANGAERCVAASRSSDGLQVRQCQAGGVPRCAAGQVWAEDVDRCVTQLIDTDGDGFSADDNDCDDNNAGVYPGAPEICDDLGRDEDCDLGTVGDRDADDDGHVSSQCFNWGPEAGG